MTNLLYSGDDEYTYFGPTETAPLLGLEGKVYDCHATQTQRIAELEAEVADVRRWLADANTYSDRLLAENDDMRKRLADVYTYAAYVVVMGLSPKTAAKVLSFDEWYSSRVSVRP